MSQQSVAELKTLYISQTHYGDDAGALTGTIEYEDSVGQSSIKVKLDHTTTVAILSLVRDVMRQRTEEAMHQILNAFTPDTPTIEHEPDPQLAKAVKDAFDDS